MRVGGVPEMPDAADGASGGGALRRTPKMTPDGRKERTTCGEPACWERNVTQGTLDSL